ncbi:MAG TPA: hypothetical protein VFH78_09020, partial [Candidatus Thermoplasmatota archaeon]|nr:hypothetical protein [Candidatus Thermoplasmatota archaeon]
MILFRPALLVVPLLLSLAMPAASVSHATTCEAPAADLVVCAVEGGFVATRADGTRAFSHGPDAIPVVPTAAPLLPDPGVACVERSEPHIRIVYAWPRDANDAVRAVGEATRKPLVVPGVLHANAIVYHEAMEHGVPIRWKTLCDENGLPLVEDVTLELRATQFNFWALADELARRGYGGADEKVLIF